MKEQSMSTSTPLQTDTSPTTPPDIGGSGVSTSMNSTQSAASIMQMYTNVVLQTPIIQLPSAVDQMTGSTVVEQLPQDQKTAQAHATYYLQTLNPQMSALVSTIIGYANQWNAMYKELLFLAMHIDEGDNQQQFIDGINILIAKCNAGATQATNTASVLTTFATQDLDADVAAFNLDYQYVNQAYGEGSTEQQELQKEIAADQKAMDTACWVMAGSALGAAVGGVAVVVGIFGEFETAGASSALVVGGFALFAGSATVGAVALSDWSQANKDLIQATAELSQDEALLSATNLAMTNISSLQSACQQASSAVLGLSSSWSSIASNLQVTIDQLEQTEDASSWLVPQLQAANDDWQATLALAETLQANGILPVQTESDNG
jgi:non-hemolytic enterotoxin B/C